MEYTHRASAIEDAGRPLRSLNASYTVNPGDWSLVMRGDMREMARVCSMSRANSAASARSRACWRASLVRPAVPGLLGMLLAVAASRVLD